MARPSFNGYRWATNPKASRKDAIILQQLQKNANELNSEKDTEEPIKELLHQEPEVPLFVRDSPEGKKGDAQDEKDKTSE